MAKKSAPGPEDVVMSFGDHIEEFRRRLIYALIGVAIAMAATLYYGRSIIAFIYAPLAEIQRLADLPTQTYTRSSVSGFAIYVKVSLIAALIVSGPWVLYQLWRFIESGLYEAERRTATLLMGLSGIMTALALVFMYYIFLPATLAFFIFWTTTYPIPTRGGDGFLHWISKKFISMNESTLLGPTTTRPTLTTQSSDQPLVVPVVTEDPSPAIEGQVWFNKRLNQMRMFHSGRVHIFNLTGPSMMVPLIDPNEYLSEVTILTLVIVIVFHLPVVMAVLGLTGLIKPETLGKRRKVIFFSCFVAAVLFTPGQDVFSNIALPIIMCGLFEIGLLFMRYFYKRHKRHREAQDDAANELEPGSP